MALNLESEQRLQKAGLIKYYQSNEAAWLAAAKECHQYVIKSFPKGSVIRHDDIAKVLLPSAAVDTKLTSELDRLKLTQKFWVAYFVDLVIDRCWKKL